MNEYNNDNYNGNTNSDEKVTVYRFEPASQVARLQSSYEEELNRAGSKSPYAGDSGNGNGGDRGDRPRRNAVRPLFAAFLAGAVMVGGISYLSDRLNLFTGGEATVASTASGGSSYSGSAGVTTASLGADEKISTVFDQANPAVVEIENYGVERNSQGSWLFGGRGGWMDPRQQSQQQQPSQSEPVLMGTGTGFFFNEDGYILTNEHVVADATELKVTVPGYDEPLTAKLVNADHNLDLAVLKVESPDGSKFPALTIGDSDRTAIGDWVIAIGNPYGLDHTMTVGVLSAKERPITIAEEDGSEHQYEHLLQTDASINPGNSGGPLLNDKGEVIGVNTAVNAEAQGIGFAIPTSTIQSALTELMAGTNAGAKSL